MTAKILEVVGSLTVGGAERVALEVAAGLAQRGWETGLLVADPDAGFDDTVARRSLRTEAEGRGVTVHRVPFAGVGDRAARTQMARFLIDSGTQLIHVHNRPQDWQMIAVAALAGVPALYTVHSPYSHAKTLHRLIYGVVGRAVPRLICVSRTVANQIAKTDHIPESQIRVVYNGIRMDLYTPPRRDDPQRARLRAELGFADGDFGWLCAARLANLKGQGFLLDAMAALPSRSRARLALAGDGPLEAAMKEQAARLKLGERVRFLGARRDVPALLGAADGYACASQTEGHPLSLLEAMAMNLPVVAPRLPAIEEISIPGAPLFYGPKHGIRAETHAPAQIAEALLAVEDAPDAFAETARLSRDHVARAFSREGMLDAHEELYREILAQAATGAGPLHRRTLGWLARRVAGPLLLG